MERRTGLGAQVLTRSPFFALPAPGQCRKPRVDALTFLKGLCVHERMPYRFASTFQTLPVHARGVSPFADGFAQVASPFVRAPA